MRRHRVHASAGRSGRPRRPFRTLCGREVSYAAPEAHPERVTCPTCQRRMIGPVDDDVISASAAIRAILRRGVKS